MMKNFNTYTPNRLFKPLLAGLCVGTMTWAQAAPKVVSSIYPLQQIANAIVGEQTGLIVDSYLSPHDYKLKPQDVQKIGNADIFLWANEHVAPQLAKAVSRRENGVTLTAAKLPDIELLKLGKDAHDHHEAHEHGETHDHEKVAYDPHLWLSPHNAKVIASALAKKLSKIDSANAGNYAKNLKGFIADVDASKADIEKQLKANPPKPYFIFHDAYGYFEHEFGLKHAGTLRAHAGQAPRTQHIVKLQQHLKAASDACLFTEPQFNSPLVKQLVNDTRVTISTLDPIGYQKKQGNVKNGYTQLLQRLAEHLQTCPPVE